MIPSPQRGGSTVLLYGLVAIMFITIGHKKVLLFATLFVGHITAASQKSNEFKPNFVILFADDVSSFTHNTRHNFGSMYKQAN